MKLIVTYKTPGQHDVSLYREKQKLCVMYGQDTRSGLDWDKAATRLGYCLMHALECNGKLDFLKEGEN